MIKFIFWFHFSGLFISVAGTKDKFPNGFVFGFSTASYQIEGAWNEDGKGENTWDRLVHTYPDKIIDKSNGDIACDSYYKFKDDVQLLKDVEAQMYRFSLSWSRILPKGDVSEINNVGVQYYNNLINELLKNNIQPMVTLYHWDLPQPLQDLGGWPNPIMIDYFEDYARLAFQLFGDRVNWWLTFNEPLQTCSAGYGNVFNAPMLNMSGIADYLCAHTIIKAHARVFHIYDKEFRNIQKGNISVALDGGWCDPLTSSKEDEEAAETVLEFQLGWFLRPFVKGDYPPIMRQKINTNSKSEHRLRSRLPYFSDHWKAYIKGTLDFLGINHYTTYLATPSKRNWPVPSLQHDQNVSISQNSSWPGSAAPWLKVEPTGFRKKLNWLKNYTGNMPIFITENGYADKGELNDLKRINYHRLYLKELLKAIYNDSCNVIGYSAWSLIDNFEWLSGYTVRFGVYHVNFTDPNRQRKSKASVPFFKELIRTKKLPSRKRIT